MSSASVDYDSHSTSLVYNVIAVVIFCLVSFCFFLPCNPILPLDRRSASVLGATLCYASRSFMFPHNKMDLVDAIDFDVLVLLGGIMAINFIMVHQTETKRVIRYVQGKIQMDPVHGFWLVSIAAFIVSPFLTNDGVCLLFVEPILNAFESLPTRSHGRPPLLTSESSELILMKSDALFFLLALACSSNIGSSLTYTGNPQNMIVAGDSLSVLSPLQFLGYMILPSFLSFVVTTLWIQRIWLRTRVVMHIGVSSLPSKVQAISNHEAKDSGLKLIIQTEAHTDRPIPTAGLANRFRRKYHVPILSPYRIDAPVVSPPRKNSGRVENTGIIAGKVVKVLMVPFPYAMLLMMGIMIALIFVDLISISGLVCITACVMVVTLVLGNHYRGINIWGTMPSSNNNLVLDGSYPTRYPPHVQSTSSSENKDHPFTPPVGSGVESQAVNIESMNQFFEELFNSIDYNLLLIFLGLFVVVENLGSTGIPKSIWNKIVGRAPFDTITSVSGISLFVLVASQFLGNVAVCQLIKPNVEVLDDDARRYAWAVISFVATIGGNLTVPGSAANIIVAEKAARIDSSAAITFFNHFAVCFFITLFCCALGAILITGTVICDDGMMGIW
mmetsp:Transcript_26293/g.44365  ORF Transcript_26293/g.44365 Transcript_26293/m.44365 type:complete len:614 (+) Transcript_26293:352-2193(+)